MASSVTNDTSHEQAPDDGDLLGFVSQVSGSDVLRVEESYGDGFVRLRVGEAERRQAKHDIRCVEDAVVEMLRNARDAGARHIYLACNRDGDARSLVMLDDGAGIPEGMRERIFDARVTSKLESVHMDRWGVHGRGMALFSIHENAEEARVVTSDTGLGSSILVRMDTTHLAEKVDQSTWPSVGTDEDGHQSVVRGPHNIIRTCCEFALEEHGRCDVYLGSPADIIATLRARSAREGQESKLLFIDDPTTIPVVERPLVAGDARELLDIAHDLGLDVSERTAHRIMAGQIKPLRSTYARLTHTAGTQPTEVDLMRDRRGLRVSEEDLEQFGRIVERDFDFLADRYYLTLSHEPVVRVRSGKVTVTFDVELRD